MALIELGDLVAAIVGPIGGVTFGRSMAGRGCRRRAGPCNAGTAAELAARLTQSDLAKRWSLLSKTDQALWDAAGKIHPLPNRLHQYRTVSGFSIWMQLGTNVINAGQPLVNTPPTAWTTPPVLNPDVAVTLAGNITTQFTASWNEQTAIGSVIVVKATGPTHWGKTPQRQQLRTIDNVPAGTTPPITMINKWSAVYGQPPQSTPYQILWEFLPYQTSTGAQGPWIDFVLSVGGPDPSPPPTPGITASVAPSIAESLTYEYTGSTSSAAWLALTTAPGITYTAVWISADITAAPALWGGPTPTTLTLIDTFAITDAATWTAQPGWTYYVGMTPWSSPLVWTLRYAPSQVRTFPFAHLTADSARKVLIAEGNNKRLVSDVQYQGP